MQSDELSNADFVQFQALIYKLAGIHYPPEKRGLLQNRLKRRMRELDMAAHLDYLEALRRDRSGAEVQQFLNAITTNETYFFRCQRHWDYFTEFLKSHHKERAGRIGRPLKIWSAAASTGAEAYSAGIACFETYGPSLGGMRIEILGTDINDKVLAEARLGRYRPYAIAQTQKGIVQKYFTQVGKDEVQVDPKVMKLARFHTHNLLERVQGGPFDLIFLRNVMIYFDGPSKERVLRNMHDVLQPGGSMIVGESESLLNLQHPFTYVKPSIFIRPAPAASPLRKER